MQSLLFYLNGMSTLWFERHFRGPTGLEDMSEMSERISKGTILITYVMIVVLKLIIRAFRNKHRPPTIIVYNLLD